jgi:leader peptidase (prepilin peptidase) / N-methyltransferase
LPAAAAIAFLGGLVAGSFVTVAAHRVPRGLSIVGPRSKCPRCDAQIAAYDNVPVISWLLLRGRCRSCKDRISPIYPLAELSLAALFATTVAVLRDDPAELALGLIFVTVLVAVTLTDLERRVIPNSILLVAAVCCLAVAAAADPGSLPERCIAAAAAGGLLLGALLAYPRGMGMGDVKLAAVMGLFLGRSVAPALIVAFAAGALYGIVLMLRHGAAARKSAIPFGPFLALGGVVGLLAGEQLIDAYLGAFAH